jgi:uncharacterized protein
LVDFLFLRTKPAITVLALIPQLCTASHCHSLHQMHVSNKSVTIAIHRLLLGVLALLSFHASCFSQQGLFWAVVKPGTADTSYLLGTLHTYPKRVVQLPETVKQKLSHSKQLFIEIQLDWKMVVQILTSGTISSEMMPSEDAGWTQKDWDSVKAWFVNGNHLDAQAYDRLQNNASDSKLSALYMASYGCEQGAVEEDLKAAARQRKIPIKGLDRDWNEIQTWYAHYANLGSEEWQGRSIDSLLDEGYHQLADLFISYAIQDTAALGKAGKGAVWQDGLTLVEWRNRNWMPQLNQLMQQQSFVAVGAAHLFGANGVLHLLKDAGFLCIPVITDFSGPRLQRFIARNSRDYKVVE